MVEIALDLQSVWKVKVRVEKNGAWVNTYYKPDLPRPRLEAHELMVNMGASWATGSDDFDLKAWELNGLTYQGVVGGDTIRRKMETVQV